MLTHYCRAVHLVCGLVQCAMTSRSCTRMQSASGHTGMAALVSAAATLAHRTAAAQARLQLQLPLLLLVRESSRTVSIMAVQPPPTVAMSYCCWR
jgi:hypothetical protein